MTAATSSPRACRTAVTWAMAPTAPDRTLVGMDHPTPVDVRPGTAVTPRPGRVSRVRRLSGLVVVAALVGIAPAASGSAAMPSLADARAASAAGAGWSTLGEFRVSPRPTSLTNRSREPIVAAHPFNPSRLAVVYAAGPGEHSHPVIRISHDAGRTWRTVAGHPRGGGSHPMVAWGPGPRQGRARLYYTAMGGPAPNYHFIVSYSDNEGRTWHQGFIANTTRGWHIGIEDLVVDNDRSSPNYGTVYLAYNWPKDPDRGDGLHVVASGDYGHTFGETEIPKLAPPAGYPDAWRIGYKLATAPDGSAYVAGYQLDMKHWHESAPFAKGGSANIGRIAFGVARLRFDRAGPPPDPRPERARHEAAGDGLEPRPHAGAEGRQRGPGGAAVGDGPRRRFRRPHLLRARRRRADPHPHQRRPGSHLAPPLPAARPSRRRPGPALDAAGPRHG